MNKLFLLCSLLSMSVYSQKIDEFKRIEIDGFFTNPLFSPTGEYVLLTGEHLKGVYLLNLTDRSVKKISEVQGSGYGYSWDETGTSFYYKEKPEDGYYSDSRVMNYSMEKQRAEKVEDIDPNFLPSYKGNAKDSQVVVYTNINSLKIEAKDLATSKYWIVTNDEGQFYNAILSPDGKKVAVHNGPFVYVYDIDGKSPGINTGTGIATAWTADSKYLIGFLDESSDGHTVTNSELYLFNVQGGRAKKLTDTEVISEMFPTIHNEKVIFSDDKTGRIFIATIK